MEKKLNKTQIKEAQAKIRAYQNNKLIDLQKNIRSAFTDFDKGKIDAFDLDEAIHEYSRASKAILDFVYSNSLHGLITDLPKLLAIIDNEEQKNQ